MKRSSPIRVVAATLVAGLAAACAPVIPNGFCSKGTGPQNFRLVVWNPGPRSTTVRVSINEVTILQKLESPARIDPAIVDGCAGVLPQGHYTVAVVDESTGAASHTEFKLRRHKNVHVSIMPVGIRLSTTDDPREGYDWPDAAAQLQRHRDGPSGHAVCLRTRRANPLRS